MSGENISQEFRLKNIDQRRNYWRFDWRNKAKWFNQQKTTNILLSFKIDKTLSYFSFYSH